MPPRHPKAIAFTVRLGDDVNLKLERLADQAGLNKSVAAALCIAAGVNLLGPVIGGPRGGSITDDDVARVRERQAHDIAADVISTAEL